VSGPDLSASVRQRLINKSRAQGRPFQELLQYFAMERFLYRLSKSAHSERFVLKGALLLSAWRGPLARPTMDIDLAGKTSNELAHIESVIRDVCGVAAPPDGLEFNPTSIELVRIKEDAEACPEAWVQVSFDCLSYRFRPLLWNRVGPNHLTGGPWINQRREHRAGE
jgi:hypothetical protein